MPIFIEQIVEGNVALKNVDGRKPNFSEEYSPLKGALRNKQAHRKLVLNHLQISHYLAMPQQKSRQNKTSFIRDYLLPEPPFIILPLPLPFCQALAMDNSRELVEKIAGLYAERLLSDVLLVVGDQQLPAHRLILAASSQVFQVSSISES